MALACARQLPAIKAAFHSAKQAFDDAERLHTAEGVASSGGQWKPWGMCSFPGAGDTFPASLDVDKAELCVPLQCACRCSLRIAACPNATEL